MRRLFISAYKVVLGISLTACATSPNVEPQPKAGPAAEHQPEPAKTIPAAPIAAGEKGPLHSGPWQFTYTSGTYTYVITTAAQVTALSDTNNKRTLQTASKKAMVSVSQDGEVAIVSSSALTPDSSTICDTVGALTILKHQLVPKLPRLLVANSTWYDSTNVTVCLGLVPSQANITEQYVVLGDTTYGGVSALRVQRSDSITANGEGKIGQHRLLLAATGNGTTELYFDPTAGKLLGSVGTQGMKLDITTSGQTNHFTQYVTQHTTLLINP